MSRTSLDSVDLRSAWEENAPAFIAWVRRVGLDSYWHFHRDAFLELVPEPGIRTLDLGCGEGRVSRDLTVLGHRVVGIDSAPTMIAAARSASRDIPLCLADAAELPLRAESFDLVVAFMSLHDIDPLEAAAGEAARVLVPGGRLCMAIVHPLNSAGAFEGGAPDSPFVIRDSYLDASYHRDEAAHDDLTCVFVSAHRPVQVYTDALAQAGFLIERLTEPTVPTRALETERTRRWLRVPLFLHLRAVKR